MGGKPFPDVEPSRRRVMARIGQKGTAPELVVRRALHRAGLRFRLHRRDLPGTPDLTLPGRKVAVFVHGCFWHRHDCRAGRMPKTRADYWRAKLQRNVERDAQAQAALRALGWSVVVIWECEANTPETLGRFVQALADRPAARGAK